MTFEGHGRSLVMWLFDSPRSVSYLSLIVANPVSLTVFELFELKYSPPCHVTLALKVSCQRSTFDNNVLRLDVRGCC